MISITRISISFSKELLSELWLCTIKWHSNLTLTTGRMKAMMKTNSSHWSGDLFASISLDCFPSSQKEPKQNLWSSLNFLFLLTDTIRMILIYRILLLIFLLSETQCTNTHKMLRHSFSRSLPMHSSSPGSPGFRRPRSLPLRSSKRIQMRDTLSGWSKK